MAHQSNYRLLINRGRKAGLNTRELYSAMGSGPAEGTDLTQGQLDGNGFVSSYDAQGRRIFVPVNQTSRN